MVRPASGQLEGAGAGRAVGPFFGRAAELARLAELGAAGARVITLVGAPGIGKSRLALRWAEQREERGAAVARVDVAELGDVEELELRLAAARRPRPGPGGAGERLFLLDNLEHLVEEVAARMPAWLRDDPRASFLLTTRERLRVAGEHVLELGPLGLPPLGGAELAGVLASEAGQLFLERAPLELAPAQAGELAELLHQLDGNPLAIELAAVRAAVLDLAQLRRRLAQRFQLLALGARGASARQATLWGAIDWSWSRLSAFEQTALAQCSVFRGTFTLAAAEAVLELRGADDGPPPATLDVLQALVEKSLLTSARATPGAPARFGLYASIRDYAGARLAESAGGADAALRHALYFEQVGRDLVRAAEPPRPGGLLARVALEMEDLLGAFERGLQRPASAAIAAARAFESLDKLELLLARQARTGMFTLLGRAARDVVALLEARGAYDAPVQVALTAFTAVVHAAVGRAASARGLFERALEHAAPRARGAVLCNLGACLGVRAWPERHAALVEALAIAREEGDQPLEAACRSHLGALYFELARPEEALVHWARAGAAAAALGWHLEEALLCADRAAAHLELARWDAARAELTGAERAARAAGDARVCAGVVGNLGCVAHEAGELDEAAARYAHAIEALSALGARRLEGVFLGYLGALEAERGELAAAHTALDAAAARAADYGEPFDVEKIACHRALISVGEARAAAARGDARRSAELRAEAAAALAGTLASSPDLRAARRLLRRALGEAAYAVAHDGSWFCPPQGGEVSLARRHVLRRLLGALAATPAESVAAERLIELGWPGEQMSPIAAQNRLHVALTTLRNLGLRELLQREGDGYRLVGGVTVVSRPGPTTG
ncbi:MAG: hypothetical protein R3B48_20885 [Kofleriaceae bacterium]